MAGDGEDGPAIGDDGSDERMGVVPGGGDRVISTGGVES